MLYFISIEGVIVVKVDYLRETHDQLSGISNLEVMCIIKTLHTKEVVKRVFNWCVGVYAVVNWII